MCPRGPLPARPDASCTREKGLEALLAALESPTPPKRSSCDDPWTNDRWNARSHRFRPSATEVRTRDIALAKAESCGGVNAGLVRLTRAALWPECADALATETPDANVTLALRGYALAAQLHRHSFRPSLPDALPPATWVSTVIRAIEGQVPLVRRAQSAVEALPEGTYGRAVADLAFANVRQGLFGFNTRIDTQDIALRNKVTGEWRAAVARYAPEAEAANARGYRAAQLASEWSLLNDAERLSEGEAFRAPRLFILPPLAGAPSKEPVPRLAALLPSYVAARLLDVEQADTATVRALVQSGFDPALRRALARHATPGVTPLLVHARLVLAARSQSAADAAEAARLADTLPKPESTTLLVISRALKEALETPKKGDASSLLTGIRRLGVAADAATDPVDREILFHDAHELAENNGLLETLSTVRTARNPPSSLGCGPHLLDSEFDGCTCPYLESLY